MLDASVLTAAGINYQEGLHRFANNDRLYEKYLLKFIDDPNFEKAKAALEAEDYEEIKNTVHALKGVSGNLSMIPLFGLCSEIVESIRGGKPENVAGLFEKMVPEYEKMCKAIKDAGK